MRIRFILPLPPSVNHQYTLRDNTLTLSNDAQVYKSSLIKALAKLKASGNLNFALLDAAGTNNSQIASAPKISASLHKRPLSMRYEFFLHSIGSRDLDNGVKLVQDAICEALGIDDRNVVEIYMAKRVDTENPRLIVTMTLLDFWDAHGDMSLFRKPEDADAEFNLFPLVRRCLTKASYKGKHSLSSLEELIERFKWK